MEEPLVAPTFAGIDTFWRAPFIQPEQVPPGHVAVMGVPHDMTLSTRQGTRHAPRAIRQQSCHFIGQIRSGPTPEAVDLDTGKRLRVPESVRLVDCGDMVVYPNDLERTAASIRKTERLLVSREAFPVVLGGDHYATFPLVSGFSEGLLERGLRSIGYLHIDGHLDAMDDNKLWGKHWHGSPARRIAELPSVSLRNMVWLGPNGFTFGDEWDFVRGRGLTLLTASQARQLGMRHATRKAIDVAADGVDAVYLSLDIDVVDFSLSPGTGSTNFGGITPTELLDAMDVLSTVEAIKGMDVMEVAPSLDPSGITTRLAASAIFTFLAPRLFQVT